MKPIQIRSIDTQGLRQALTTLAVAAALAGWAVLARPDAATTTTTAVAVPAAQAPAIQATAPAPRLRVVTAAPRPVTTTRSSR